MRVRSSLFNIVLGEIDNPNFILFGNDSTNDSISVNSSFDDITTSLAHSQPLVVIILGHMKKSPPSAPIIKKLRFLIIVKIQPRLKFCFDPFIVVILIFNSKLLFNCSEHSHHKLIILDQLDQKCNGH